VASDSRKKGQKTGFFRIGARQLTIRRPNVKDAAGRAFNGAL
jgi:hypothetical protein